MEFDYNDGTIIVDLPFIKWRIDDREWNYSVLGKRLWHKEPFLHNNCVIDIENHSKSEIELYINNQKIKVAKDSRYLLGDALIELTDNKENSVFLSVNEKKFLLFKVLNNEELSDFDIDIESKTIDFSNFFVGNSDARFLTKLSNEYNSYELETSIKDTFNDDIIDGEYNVEISLVDYFDNKILLLERNYCIGNPDKFCFNGCKIVLTKFNSFNSGKIKLKNIYITEMKYLREETIGSVFSGILLDKKIKYKVDIYKKDERTLKFYFVDGDELLPVGFDKVKMAFTKKAIDNKNIISCTSCYYDIEEI